MIDAYCKALERAFSALAIRYKGPYAGSDAALVTAESCIVVFADELSRMQKVDAKEILSDPDAHSFGSALFGMWTCAIAMTRLAQHRPQKLLDGPVVRDEQAQTSPSVAVPLPDSQPFALLSTAENASSSSPDVHSSSAMKPHPYAMQFASLPPQERYSTIQGVQLEMDRLAHAKAASSSPLSNSSPVKKSSALASSFATHPSAAEDASLHWRTMEPPFPERQAPQRISLIDEIQKHRAKVAAVSSSSHSHSHSSSPGAKPSTPGAGRKQHSQQQRLSKTNSSVSERELDDEGLKPWNSMNATSAANANSNGNGNAANAAATNSTSGPATAASVPASSVEDPFVLEPTSYSRRLEMLSPERVESAVVITRARSRSPSPQPAAYSSYTATTTASALSEPTHASDVMAFAIAALTPPHPHSASNHSHSASRDSMSAASDHEYNAVYDRPISVAAIRSHPSATHSPSQSTMGRPKSRQQNMNVNTVQLSFALRPGEAQRRRQSAEAFSSIQNQQQQQQQQQHSSMVHEHATAASPVPKATRPRSAAYRVAPPSAQKKLGSDVVATNLKVTSMAISASPSSSSSSAPNAHSTTNTLMSSFGWSEEGRGSRPATSGSVSFSDTLSVSPPPSQSLPTTTMNNGFGGWTSVSHSRQTSDVTSDDEPIDFVVRKPPPSSASNNNAAKSSS
jgi:hypothetical protein